MTKSLVFIHYPATLHMKNSKIWEKAIETAFSKYSANWCPMRQSKIHWKVSTLEFYFNIVSRLLHASLLGKTLRHRCFPIIILRTLSLVVLESFSWPSNQNLRKKAIYYGYSNFATFSLFYYIRSVFSFLNSVIFFVFSVSSFLYSV